ncbi:hypothetical protein ACIBF5_29965 [Micromonospora sp. NPDC050417]|uniref:hypothetical protein n=1 Tax=Micromonospora sp. NPDC050417 TaxID=3364280 RepID=UPI003791D9B7
MRIAADLDVINSGPLKYYQEQVEKAQRLLDEALAENWPPGHARSSVDHEVLEQMGPAIKGLRNLIGAYNALSAQDAHSVDVLGKVLADTSDLTVDLAKQINVDNAPNRV